MIQWVLYKMRGIDSNAVKMWNAIIRNRFFDGFTHKTPLAQNNEILLLEQTLKDYKENYPDTHREYRIAAKHYLVEMQYAVRMRKAQVKADKIFAKMQQQQSLLNE